MVFLNTKTLIREITTNFIRCKKETVELFSLNGKGMQLRMSSKSIIFFTIYYLFANHYYLLAKNLLPVKVMIA